MEAKVAEHRPNFPKGARVLWIRFTNKTEGKRLCGSLNIDWLIIVLMGSRVM